MADRTYIAIDLKSFYASVECAERGLNPLNTNLVVADASRTEKTICLAVSPSLKAYGIPGRARLFEVIERVREINSERLSRAVSGGHAVRTTPQDAVWCFQPSVPSCTRKKPAKRPPYRFSRGSCDAQALRDDPSLELSYIIAPPRMSLYMEYSTRIFDIYLKYVSREDIHVYSVDECFIDVTDYLNAYHLNARNLAMTMIREVLYTTGITATCGIGTNLYLCKVAMDIVAKHAVPDKDGVRIAELDEMSYRKLLWTHQPLTDFWRVGRGIALKLEKHNIFTMGDIARCSMARKDDPLNADLLYRLFGVNAELLIDHAWGWEPCTISEIRGYSPESRSLSTGQVLSAPYDFEKGLLIVKEMSELLALDLVDKQVSTDQLVLVLGYEALKDGQEWSGPVTVDFYGRVVPKHAVGTVRLGRFCSSSRRIREAVSELYCRLADPRLSIRRVNITAERITEESELAGRQVCEQTDLFTDYARLERERRAENERFAEEHRLQRTILDIRKKYGKNAILNAMNFEEGGTTILRNGQIGGHRA